MNKIFASALMAVAMMGCVSEAEACSNFIVGAIRTHHGTIRRCLLAHDEVAASLSLRDATHHSHSHQG